MGADLYDLFVVKLPYAVVPFVYMCGRALKYVCGAYLRWMLTILGYGAETLVDDQVPILIIKGLSIARGQSGSFDLISFPVFTDILNSKRRVYCAPNPPLGSSEDNARHAYHFLKGGEFTSSSGQRFVYRGVYPEWGSSNPIHIVAHSTGCEAALRLDMFVRSRQSGISIVSRADKWIDSITMYNATFTGTPVLGTLYPLGKGSTGIKETQRGLLFRLWIQISVWLTTVVPVLRMVMSFGDNATAIGPLTPLVRTFSVMRKNRLFLDLYSPLREQELARNPHYYTINSNIVYTVCYTDVTVPVPTTSFRLPMYAGNAFLWVVGSLAGFGKNEEARKTDGLTSVYSQQSMHCTSVKQMKVTEWISSHAPRQRGTVYTVDCTPVSMTMLDRLVSLFSYTHGFGINKSAAAYLNVLPELLYGEERTQKANATYC